MKLKDSTVSF